MMINHVNIPGPAKNYVQGPGMPLGLGMALSQNSDAMQYFASLPRARQQAIIDHTQSIHSSVEMRAFVAKLSQGNW